MKKILSVTLLAIICMVFATTGANAQARGIVRGLKGVVRPRVIVPTVIIRGPAIKPIPKLIVPKFPTPVLPKANRSDRSPLIVLSQMPDSLPAPRPATPVK